MQELRVKWIYKLKLKSKFSITNTMLDVFAIGII